MNYRSASDIRELFLDFFARHDHRVIKSHALIPPDDPTLYFVNAGMVQFKDIFVGERQVDYRRATTSQKCLRASGKHNDLENVGRTPRHHTFFEMLGNFSFGDYFKKGAIELAWEFLTKELGLPEDKLHITVHPEDDEAWAMWRDDMGRPEALLHHDPENFWSMGDTGPCGPCSEIHYDLGPEMSGGKELPFGHPEAEHRYIEIWNLVFMQFDRGVDGKLTPLPKPSIDTGAGLERLALVCQGKFSNYDTDVFGSLLQFIANRAGLEYGGSDDEKDVAMRVIADHSRAAAFLIADGIYPDNDGRGYVLRRIMRRAIRFGRLLGFTEPFLIDTTAQIIAQMSAVYPELSDGKETIHRIVLQEERRFGRTINQGNKRLAEELAQLKGEGSAVLPGRVAFELYDTHGFPRDLTELICGERGITVDGPGFDEAMEEQRERARAASTKFQAADASVYAALVDDGVETSFLGYAADSTETTVLALLVDGTRVPKAAAGQRLEIVTRETPCYAESGGQVGDTGILRVSGGPNEGSIVRIIDTQKPYGDLFVHLGVVEQGHLAATDSVSLTIDLEGRAAIRKNHSATHLLHHALREVLGEHVRQRGSLVASDRLRFDFSHTGAMTPDEVLEVERLVNTLILANEPVGTELLSYDEAIASGAIAFFGEKYGDEVRMLRVGSQSVELCGGTHCQATGEIGLFKIVSESAISSGVRRLEAVTGLNAVAWAQERASILAELAAALNTSAERLPERVERLVDERKKLHTALDKARIKAHVAEAGARLESAPVIDGHKVASLRMDGVPGKELRSLGESLRDRLGSGILLLVAEGEGGKVSMVIAATKDSSQKVHAGKLVGSLAPLIGGRGGGRPDLAQAGGPNPDGIDALMTNYEREVRAALEA